MAKDQVWKFTVYDPTYRARKTVYVEAPTRAAAQQKLIGQGYTQIKTAK